MIEIYECYNGGMIILLGDCRVVLFPFFRKLASIFWRDFLPDAHLKWNIFILRRRTAVVTNF